MMKAMLRLISAARVLVALVSGASSLGCGDDEEAPPIAEDPGPSTGSTCPSEQTLTYESFGSDFFASYCTSCHSSELSGPDRHGATEGPFNRRNFNACQSKQPADNGCQRVA